MISGVIAGADGASQSAGAATLLASADFKNGIYSYGAATLAASDVLDSTTNISPGSGLAMTTTPPQLKFEGDFFNLFITANWTVVITFNPSTVADAIIFLEGTNGSGTDLVIYTYTSGGGVCEMYDQNDSGSQSRFVDSILAPNIGTTNKLAVTRTNSQALLSLNGAATVSNWTAVTLGAGMNTVGIADGSSLGNMGYMEKLEFYSPVFGSDLQSLS